MSKLQALAAARKKKREENKSDTTERKDTTKNDAPNAPETETETETLRARVSKMDIRRDDSPKTPDPAVPLAPADSLAAPAPALDGAADSQDSGPVVPYAQPSTFAQALFRSASEIPRPNQHSYAPPWLAFTTDEALVEAFSKPSPDDVVQTAQSQGSRFARK